MKTTLTLVSLLINIVIYSQNFSGIAIYKKQISYSKTEINKDNSESSKANAFMNLVLNDAIDEVDKLEFELVFNHHESLFRAKPSIGLKEGMGYKLALSIEGGNGNLYTNYSSKTQVWQREAYGETFLINSKTDNISWEITNEQKQIGNYICIKAKGSRVKDSAKGVFIIKYEAWFASKINIPFGPARFINLPGLVFEVSIFLPKQTVTYKLTKLEIKPIDQITIKKPTKGIEITDQEFKKIGKTMRNKFIKLNN